MRVLVTGAGGFVGSYLAQHLAQDYAVIANYRTPTDAVMRLRDERLDLVQCDVVHTSRLGGPFEAVVHCASAAGPWCSADRVVADNIAAMHALVRAAAEWQTKAFIFLSSISTYGEIRAPVVYESTPRINPDPYGMSKTFGEELLKSYRVPSLSLRLPGILGPGANLRNWLPNVVRKMKAKEVITAYNLDAEYNNAVHVADLAEFIGDVLGKPLDRSDEVVLGAGSMITVRDALYRVANELDVPLYLAEEATNRTSFQINHAKARQMYGYRPMHVAEMISRYVTETANA